MSGEGTGVREAAGEDKHPFAPEADLWNLPEGGGADGGAQQDAGSEQPGGAESGETQGNGDRAAQSAEGAEAAPEAVRPGLGALLTGMPVAARAALLAGCLLLIGIAVVEVMALRRRSGAIETAGIALNGAPHGSRMAGAPAAPGAQPRPGMEPPPWLRQFTARRPERAAVVAGRGRLDQLASGPARAVPVPAAAGTSSTGGAAGPLPAPPRPPAVPAQQGTAAAVAPAPIAPGAQAAGGQSHTETGSAGGEPLPVSRSSTGDRDGKKIAENSDRISTLEAAVAGISERALGFVSSLQSLSQRVESAEKLRLEASARPQAGGGERKEVASLKAEVAALKAQLQRHRSMLWLIQKHVGMVEGGDGGGASSNAGAKPAAAKHGAAKRAAAPRRLRTSVVEAPLRADRDGSGVYLAGVVNDTAYIGDHHGNFRPVHIGSEVPGYGVVSQIDALRHEVRFEGGGELR